MLCSSKGRQKYFARDFSTPNKKAGFTLIELLISIAIIGVLTGIVLVRYGSFDSTILLKSAAYEVGLNLREAQVKSVSAVRGGTGFDQPFGLSFDTTTPGQYILFSDNNSSDDLETDPPEYDSGPPEEDDEELLTFDLGPSIEIDELCVADAGVDECGLTNLDISFQRPEYRASMSASDGSSTFDNRAYAKIKVKSTRGSGQVFTVTISQLGQINVTADLP